MIEIGNERTFETGARRVASVFDSMGLLLALVWLLRGFLFLSSQSMAILAAILTFGLIGRLFRIKTSASVARAVSSLFGNIAFWCVGSILLIWFLGWVALIQNPGNVPAMQFPAVISQQVPNLVVAALVAVLVAIGARGFAPRHTGPLAQGPAILVKSGSYLDLGKAKLTLKKDSIALPIKRFRRTLGAMVFGDVVATFETPMGTVTGTLQGPVTTMGIPFRGERAAKEEVSGLTGKSLGQLIDEADIDPSVPHSDRNLGGGDMFSREGSVDLPFVHVSKGVDGETVEVGPVTVRTGRRGEEEVKVGPFSISSDDWDGMSWGRPPWAWSGKGWKWSKSRRNRFGSWWLAKGRRGSSYVMTASFNGIDAKWNGSSLRLRGDWMQMTVGSDGFTYSPDEVETYSPLHNLHITQSKATLNSGRFTLNVYGDKVVFRAEKGTKVTNSLDLAKDMMELLAETAKKQISSVMEGQPIELDEMLARTEEVLKKYE